MENNYGNRSWQDRFRNRDSDWQNRNWENDRDRDRYRREQGNRSSDWNNERMDNYGSNQYSSYGDNYGRYGNEYNRYGNRGSGKYDETYWTNDYDRWNRNRNYENTGYSGGEYNDRRNYDNDRDWWDRTSDEISSWFGDEEAKRRRRMDKMYGPHRGKGPKGYTRSDEKIKEDISEKLYHDSYIDASDIDITVSNGEVTLTGTVESREAKHRAEDMADSVTGVKDVTNNLKVNKTSDLYNSGTANMNTTTGTRSGMNGITDNNDNNRKRSTAGV
jgi:osmotically-inducible protein OsmY